ncbi:hypothetical protein [Neisseria gonorrhoeae]|uniref:hypothetical protein n=1 Tax=Neisseria gonorrhoeae TaxID=485 RepID=UPI00277B4A91|nr:hypothetical protein [Neisseria gonorrhoeae]
MNKTLKRRVFRHTALYTAIFDGILAAQIERYAQPWMILQFVNGQIFAAWVRMPIQLSVSPFCQTDAVEGKSGFIDKFGTA